jgi:hypothetical protein
MLMFMPVLMLGIGLLSGIFLLVKFGPVFPVVMSAIWVLVTLVISSQYLRLPHTIEWSSEGTITFRSYLGDTTTSPSEIVSIEPNPNAIGTLRIRYGKKKLNLLSQFDDFHEFLHRLKAENPAVEFRGC